MKEQTYTRKQHLSTSIFIVLLNLMLPGLASAQGPTDPVDMEAFF